MRRVAVFRLGALGATVLVLGGASPARAQASRVFASARSGNDLNSCDNINTPCQTLQGSVNQVAAGGAVLILDSGGYGPVTINKSVTIEAPTGIEAFIHPSSGVAIGVSAPDGGVVVLRGPGTTSTARTTASRSFVRASRPGIRSGSTSSPRAAGRRPI